MDETFNLTYWLFSASEPRGKCLTATCAKNRLRLIIGTQVGSDIELNLSKNICVMELRISYADLNPEFGRQSLVSLWNFVHGVGVEALVPSGPQRLKVTTSWYMVVGDSVEVNSLDIKHAFSARIAQC